MPSLSFGFASALFLLPLAGLPILLHLLFKQKSPIIPFSTLRFIKLSVQRTAARRRIQKWLLLACRALLIALLIWAVAQPARKFAGNWLSAGGRSVAAAVVIDTSYSMQYQDDQITLLNRADGMVQDLLRDQLGGAKVAIFQSLPTKDHSEELRDASDILAEWSPLKPQPSPKPLVDRVASAIALLDKQPAEEKWLIVLSDFQSKEFSHPIPELKDGRTILLDLHPSTPRSAGITDVSITPRQPIPGIASETAVQVTGQPGDPRAVLLKITSPDGDAISQTAPVMATLDAGGRAVVRFSQKLPSQRWMLLTGTLTADDAMAWDHQRSQLIEVPPKQKVAVLSQIASPAERFVKLALDPAEGKLDEWPLNVKMQTDLTGQENVAVAVLSRWPDARHAIALRDFARGGKSVILFLDPGLEDSWASLDAGTKAALGDLLPSPPLTRPGTTPSRVAVADATDPLLEGLTDERFQLNAITVRKLVPMSAEGTATAVLNAVPADPTTGSRTQGLLYRKPVGSGVCFTIATAPDLRDTNFATHPTFLPLLVRMALPNPGQSSAQNVELGQAISLNGSTYPAENELQIEGPQHEQYRVKAIDMPTGRQFIFDQANEPGIYTWRKVNDTQTLALTNVQLPASEAELAYRPAASVAAPGDSTIVATSISELAGKVNKLNEGEPQWSTPIAIVMFLLCLEALMGSASKLWKPAALRAFLPGMGAQS
jgi:Aerotolerance regulator N-terminal